MNFYHFRPSCKVIKRSRARKGPFLTNHDDEVLNAVLNCPEMNLKHGVVDLSNFGIAFNYSRKVFVGGLPLDITEEMVKDTFSRFGDLVVDWPYKEDTNSIIPPKGFAFLLFEHNASVDALMQFCEKRTDGYYIRLSSAKIKNKNIQVRPWKLSGADHVFITDLSDLDERNTIFLGGVPRTVSAKELGLMLTRIFGNVSYVGIDTDSEYFYPKGAARVTFESRSSVISAVRKRFLMPTETKTRKMMEIKPYILDDQPCDECNAKVEKSPNLFCPEPECLTYYCEFCWTTKHASSDSSHHKPLIKQGLEDYVSSLKKRGFD
ncbi:cytoplasmic polyadenylation element-binding protein 2-like [Planococcus citri]|uniref:cytoplasmic polyadenylation element-binding protein 2-like n=1 Tax=Planococcus citri TaxID=170843 RepID=UPI0031F8A339